MRCYSSLRSNCRSENTENEEQKKTPLSSTQLEAIMDATLQEALGGGHNFV